MPEGHVLHRLATKLSAEFAGKPLVVQSPQGRFESSARFLNGSSLEAARAVGKHLFLQFEGARYIHIHLGLYGKWRFRPLHQDIPEPIGQVRLRLVSDTQVADLAGPNRCALVDENEVNAIISRLGPDPLDPTDSSEADFVRNVRARKKDIGELIMDQTVVAGPGNIYRAESLFRTRISPFRKGMNTSTDRLGALWADLQTLMEDGLRTGVITTVDPADIPIPPIEGDEEACRFYVYHRTGRPCIRCAGSVREKVVAGRRLFWCPSCQH